MLLLLNENKGCHKVSHWVFLDTLLVWRLVSTVNCWLLASAWITLVTQLLTLQLIFFHSLSPHYKCHVKENPLLFSVSSRLDLLCCPCLENLIKERCQVCQHLPLANLCYILFYCHCFFYSVSPVIILSFRFFSWSFGVVAIKMNSFFPCWITSSPVLKYRYGNRAAKSISCYMNLHILKILMT